MRRPRSSVREATRNQDRQVGSRRCWGQILHRPQRSTIGPRCADWVGTDLVEGYKECKAGLDDVPTARELKNGPGSILDLLGHRWPRKRPYRRAARYRRERASNADARSLPRPAPTGGPVQGFSPIAEKRQARLNLGNAESRAHRGLPAGMGTHRHVRVQMEKKWAEKTSEKNAMPARSTSPRMPARSTSPRTAVRRASDPWPEGRSCLRTVAKGGPERGDRSVVDR